MTTQTELSFDDIKKNWATYTGILGRLKDDQLNALLDGLGQRLALSPANQTTGQYGAFPGGLVATSLQMGKDMQALNEFHGNPCDIKSIYKIGFLHDIGRVGTMERDFFLEQDSEWHREKLGHQFKINSTIQTTHIQRTLFLVNQFQIVLSEEEFDALLSVDDNEAKNQLGAILLHVRNMLINTEETE